MKTYTYAVRHIHIRSKAHSLAGAPQGLHGALHQRTKNAMAQWPATPKNKNQNKTLRHSSPHTCTLGTPQHTHTHTHAHTLENKHTRTKPPRRTRLSAHTCELICAHTLAHLHICTQAHLKGLNGPLHQTLSSIEAALKGGLGVCVCNIHTCIHTYIKHIHACMHACIHTSNAQQHQGCP